MLTQSDPVTQSVGSVQVVRHAVPSQRNGAQLVEPGTLGTQAPAASHADPRVMTDPPAAQLGASHTLPAGYLRHAPAPSHAPSVPHESMPMSSQPAFGSDPAGANVQVPRWPVSAQDLQPPQASAQQIPWAHSPLRQSPLAAQESPFGRRDVHDPPWHVSPAMQSPSVVHVVRQEAPGPHRYWPQLAGTWAQAPAPSQ
jgi:hypothetical protein